MSKLLSLSAEEWRVLEPLVDAALELPADQRAAFLRLSCAAHPPLYDQLATILAQCERVASDGSLLDRSAAEEFASLCEEGADDSRFEAHLAGRYAIEGQIGSGGMAVVYRARDLRHDRYVALKVLRHTLGEDAATRFRREITLAAGLQHPHIVPVFDSGESDGRLWYTMPFVEGETLRARLQRESSLDTPQAIRLLREIADALACAHSAGVVHRDLKPENILLSGGHAVIADFGIARALVGAVRQGASPWVQPRSTYSSFIGTPLYMAPEQAAGGADIDERADFYAFGVIAYEILTGHAPFSNRKRSELAIARANETPRPLGSVREVPMGLASLVDRCLAKRPIVRPQTAREILRDLDEAAGSRLTFRRHHAAAAVAAAVVAALGIAQYRVSLPRETLEENRIVVVPFQNVSGNRSPDLVGSMATTWIQQGFALLDPVQVIAQPVVGDEIAGSGTNTVDRFALARRLHAGTIVAGTYLAGDDSLRFQAQIYRTSSREVRGVASASVGSKGDTVEAINRLRERVLAAMGLSAWMPRGTDVHIPTIGAFREFVKAQERFDRRDYAAASERLERAITLDSTYQPALVLLATSRVIRAASDLHAWEAADSLVRSIEAKRDELPTNDRVVLDYFRARTNGNGEAAYRLSRDWVERDSSWLPYDQMGISAMRTNRGYAAIKAFLTASTFPQAQDASKSNLASAYHLVGDFAAERRIGEEYGIVPTRIVASATIGNEVLINQLLDGPISSSASDAFWAQVRFRAALELRAHGFDSQADTQLEKTLAFLRARPLTETPESRLLVADIMFELGHLDSANARYRELVREASSTISIAALGRMGTTAALLKDTATARRIANELAQIQRPYVNGLKTYWRAAIAASLGEKDLAVSLLDQSLHAGTGMTAFIHVQREFFSLHDYPAFKVLMHPRSD